MMKPSLSDGIAPLSWPSKCEAIKCCKRGTLATNRCSNARFCSLECIATTWPEVEDPSSLVRATPNPSSEKGCHQLEAPDSDSELKAKSEIPSGGVHETMYSNDTTHEAEVAKAMSAKLSALSSKAAENSPRDTHVTRT